MSIKVMSKIWDESPSKENKLLTLLAIADNANDDGWAYPSQQTIASKVRVEKRSVQRIIDELRNDGEIIVYSRIDEKNPKLHLSNVYHLARYGNPDAKEPSDLRGTIQKPQGVTTPQPTGGDDSPTDTPDDTGVATGDNSPTDTVTTPGTSDPSLNHQFDSKEKENAVSLSKKLPETSKTENAPTPNSAPPPILKMYHRVAIQIMPNEKGLMYYADGDKTPIDPSMIPFTDECNAIFHAYLVALQSQGRLPDTEQNDLWEKHRPAVIALARNRRTAQQVSDFVAYAYSDEYPDNFYQRLPAPITLSAISGAIGGWLTIQEKKKADAVRKQVANTFVPPKAHAWTKEELDRIKQEAIEKAGNA